MKPIVLVLLLAMASTSRAEVSNDHDSGQNSGEQSVCELNAFPPDPKTACCGYSNANADFIVGGTQTVPGQYPWLVALEFYDAKNYKLYFGCPGILISGRYVLASSDCLKIFKDYKLVSVLLGEYDTDNQGADCITKADGTQLCNDGGLRMPIESFTSHPKYRELNDYFVNNIALIRLKENAQFTDFIRPICLPAADVNDMKTHVPLYSAGWGDEIEKSGNINFLKKNNATLKETKFCSGVMRRPVNTLHVCTEQTCEGFSGALMRQQGDQYELVGIPSYFSGDCEGEMTIVHTNVFQYMDWIEQNIQP